MDRSTQLGLYDPRNEHDACGIGFVVNIQGKRSHAVIRDGLEILRRLDHRGAIGADPLQGDGAGILIQIPDGLYREDLARHGIALPHPGLYGVAMVFMPRIPSEQQSCRNVFERIALQEGFRILHWRKVPTGQDLEMSNAVRSSEPSIWEVFFWTCLEQVKKPLSGNFTLPVNR